MIALAERDQRSENMVSGRVTVVEGLVAKPMGKRVDTESCLLNKENSKDSGIDKATQPVTPAEAADKRGHDEGHDQDTLDIYCLLVISSNLDRV